MVHNFLENLPKDTPEDGGETLSRFSYILAITAKRVESIWQFLHKDYVLYMFLQFTEYFFNGSCLSGTRGPLMRQFRGRMPLTAGSRQILMIAAGYPCEQNIPEHGQVQVFRGS
jgi:hypothetical protein